MRQSYIRFCFFNHLRSRDFVSLTGDKWLPEDEMLSLFRTAMRESFAKFDIFVKDEYNEISDETVASFLNSGVIVTEGDEYTGRYFRIVHQVRQNFIQSFMDTDEAAQRIAVLGAGALQRALARIAAEDGLYMAQEDTNDQDDETIEEDVERLDEVPASDRVVSLTHNQITELEERSSEIIEQVEKLNGIDDEPGLREIIVGQLKAGRELIRAGAFRVYLIEVTLVNSLRFLAKKYEGELVGALALSLIEALLKHIGIA